jgi:hypothetical protein
MPQSSHDLDQQKVRGICGVEHSGLAYDTRYLRISAVSNPNQLNGTSKMSNKSAHVCAKCPIPSCASSGVPLASWPTQRRISVPPIRPSRLNWMRRGRNGAGGILTGQLVIPGCQSCERKSVDRNQPRFAPFWATCSKSFWSISFILASSLHNFER